MTLIMMKNNVFIEVSTADDDGDPNTTLFHQNLHQDLSKLLYCKIKLSIRKT